jgi:hypothetical protein
MICGKIVNDCNYILLGMCRLVEYNTWIASQARNDGRQASSLRGTKKSIKS